MKIPKRPPDFIGKEDGWKYWFDEMCLLTDCTEIYNIKFENNQWFWDWQNTDIWRTDSNNLHLIVAYNNWVKKKILE